jgi:hypothetical protein
MLPAQSPGVQAAMATGTYFPLDVGDRWAYRLDSRFGTGGYETWRVDRIDTFNGVSYSVISIESASGLLGESWFRADPNGKVYVLTGNGEQLFLDPSQTNIPGPQLVITAKLSSATSALGKFADAISYSNNTAGQVIETGTLARGLGLLNSSSTFLAGSSGGFWESRALVEATVGGVRFPAAIPAMKLGIESTDLDVTGLKVTNCAVPCYFVACSFSPSTDPPGTYKPCVQARVGLENWPSTSSRSVHLQLLAPDGSTAADQTLALDSSPQDSVLFFQLPLYSKPNVPFPPGRYQLSATTSDGSAQSTLAVTIR